MPEVDEVGSHTPGPWEVEPREGSCWLIRADGMHSYIAELPDHSDDCEEEQQERALWLEQDANAMLIAAAPEMLESLHELVAGLYAVGITMPAIREATQDALDRARAVIDKAERAA